MNDLYFIFLVWRYQRRPVSLPLFHDKDFWLPMNQVTNKNHFLFDIFLQHFSFFNNFSIIVFTDDDMMT